MRLRSCLLAVVLIIGSGDRGSATDPRDPDWPCAQLRVPELSVAAIWVGPDLGDATTAWKDDPAVADLVDRLAARRTPLDEAQTLISDFLNGGDRVARGKLLFAGLFDRIDAQRTSVMSGLDRITRKQRAAAEAIRANTLALRALQDTPEQDQARIEQLGNQLAWQTRIFEDRRQVIRFACEVPVKIDQRLFALGRLIQQSME
ncbi:MAG: hypothetical protein P4M07_20605 [Xanthobacteraceae bacterium]|nr:hypothetical protein [Xanthobacteraceae bacterium]